MFHLVEVKDTASMQTYILKTKIQGLTNKHINAPLSKGLDSFFNYCFWVTLSAFSAQPQSAMPQQDTEETVKGKWIFKALSGSKASIFVTCFG